MAKQQRASSRSAGSKPLDASVSSDSGMLRRGPDCERPNDSVTPTGARPRRVEAVALYQEGLAALQAHQFSEAAALLKTVLSRFPDERELHDRVRVYLNICDR